MKHIIIRALLLLILGLVLFLEVGPLGSSQPNVASASDFKQLDTVPEGFMAIYSVADLDKIRDNLSGKYILMNDIDMTAALSEGGEFYHGGKGWEPIGDPHSYFKGVLDGNGYKISGMSINTPSSGETVYAGLFGYCYLAEFKNIIFEDAIIKMDMTHTSDSPEGLHKSLFIGGLAGSVQESKVTNCEFNGVITFSNNNDYAYKSINTSSYVGGLIGNGDTSQITDCINNGAVQGKTLSIIENPKNSGDDNVGGVVGYSQETTIENSHNYGDISASTKPSAGDGRANVGGINGTSYRSSILNSSNSGDITAESNYMTYAGGIAGQISDQIGEPSSISHSSNAGAILTKQTSADRENAGGIVGYLTESSLTYSENTGPVQGTHAGGIVGDATGIEATFDNVSNKGGISGTERSGGIVGSLTGMKISNSQNTGRITGSEERGLAGGIAGSTSSSTITDSENLGEITGLTAAGIAGMNRGSNGIIADCINKGKVTGNFVAGGIAGEFYGTTISQGQNIGSVKGGLAGGIAGSSNQSSIAKSSNNGMVSGNTVGGILGSDSQKSSIKQSYNTGTVNGDTAGGISGGLVGSNVSDTFNIGAIIATDNGGGIAGFAESGAVIKRSYHAGSLSDRKESVFPFGGIIGGAPWESASVEDGYYMDSSIALHQPTNIKDYGVEVSFAEMMQQPAFKGFDFQNIWMEGNADYVFPQLKGMPAIEKEMNLNVILKSVPEKLSYVKGEDFQAEGAALSVRTSRGEEFEVPVVADMVSGFDKDRAGQQTVAITHGDLTAFVNASVQEKYDVKFIDYDGKELKAETIVEGSSATPPEEPSRTGYTFTGWDTDYNKVTSDLTVKAKYEIKQFTVVFKNEDGNVLKSGQVGYGSTITPPPNPNKTGYTFTGWDKEFGTITADLTVTAKFEINQYTVIFKDWDGTEIGAQKVEYGGSAQAPADPSKVGHTFIEWDRNFTNVATDLTVSAKYQPITYTVIFEDYNGTILSTSKVAHGSAAAATMPPKRTGYTFAGWNQVFNTITSDLTVTAQYKVNQYKVVFKNDDGAVISTQMINHGATAIAPAVKKTGYTFTGWNQDFKTVTTDLTITAKYKINQYTVTFKNDDGRSIATNKVDHGTLVAAPKVPARSGYTFVGWFKSSKDTSPYSLKTAISSNLVLYARYAKNTAAPASVKAVSAGFSQVKVSWGRVSGAQGYEIFRASSKTGDYNKIATASSSTLAYSDRTLSTNKAYFYKIRAYRTVNGTKVYSSYSSTVSGIPVLARPFGLKAAKASSTSTKLSWSKVSEASGYEIFRAASSKGTYTKVKTLTSGSAVSYTNTRLTKGRTYYYKVRAYRIVDGKKIYSGFSSVVYRKTL
ncbi:InlB B-repeat-containing protein [Peribacillus glennii]|uniref:Fibronectin type-III domain-containing protein n=1 Tax=Peribacillus glennii TaxID=2303991 RepID=A0A372L8C1_9BACI|nr:InlB B-repeat-containing protein [Peribacillus glennii]RFU61105.1 hypothetical protein D0466_19160 [Peribacillus glennii]